MNNLFSMLLQIYSLILLARVLLSWFPNLDYNNPLVRFPFEATEPVLRPIRQAIHQAFPRSGGVDFSPLVVFLGIQLLNSLLLRLF